MHSSYYIIPKLKCQMVNIHQTTSLSVVAKLALPQSKLCNYSSANLPGSLVGEAKGLALHLSDDTGLTELLRQMFVQYPVNSLIPLS